MAKRKKPDQKLLELKRTGTLNPHSTAVSDTLFRENPFFDSKDLLQVRYEMLRRHRVEGASIVDVSSTFGVSRPTFYQAQTAFERGGLTGLLPKQRGPKEGYKLSGEVIEHVRNLKTSSPGLTTVECIQAVEEKFGINVHRRSLERAMAAKKTPPVALRFPVPAGAIKAYEALRQRAVQPDGRIEYAEGRGIFIRCGLARWAQVQVSSTTAWSPPDSHPRSASSQPEIPPTWEVELVKLVAGLILSIRQEGIRA